MQVEFNDDGDAFWAKFDNGWTLSAQWWGYELAGIGKRCVEIAAWDEDGTVSWNFEEGIPVALDTYVEGFVTSKKLGEYMNDIASITRSSAELQLIARG